MLSFFGYKSGRVVIRDFPVKSLPIADNVIENSIIPFLDKNEGIQLSKVDRRLFHLFKNKIAIKKLLHYIFYGDQDIVVKILREDPFLVLKKATIIDHAGRKFKNISPLQAAVWNRDRHMWDEILKSIAIVDEKYSYRIAETQLDEVERGEPEYVKEHGARFDFEKIINASHEYCEYAMMVQDAVYFNWQLMINQQPGELREIPDNWRSISYELFVKKLGKAQRELPICVLQEFCRTDRPCWPSPDFKDVKKPRSLNFHRYYGYVTETSLFGDITHRPVGEYEDIKFERGKGLGFDYAICTQRKDPSWFDKRLSFCESPYVTKDHVRSEYYLIRRDREMLIRLNEVRNTEENDLKEKVKKPLSLSNKLSM